ncbi:MAG: imidazoleglycerol-phosphate dehydratase HisB [Helicobacteraceae bacterium]|nr:imidazoleglycerol-phosphate dehydratase HisB [Helicobacteraceae bacterium]
MILKERTTKETQIRLALKLFGSGEAKVKTGIGFFDHMLCTLAKHSLIDLELVCNGDLGVDCHHSVEDTGIVIGDALNEAIFPAEGIERFADRIALLDEAAVQCVIDVSGRAFLHWGVDVEGRIGEFDAELTEEFFRALIANMKIGAHITMLRGYNRHHIVEAVFKAFAIALRSALVVNPRIGGIPSTKGVL